MNVLHIPQIPEDLLKIPEIAALNDRMLYIQQCIDNTPHPEPGFLGLNHTKVRRAIRRLRAGKWVPKDLGNVTPEQLAEAIAKHGIGQSVKLLVYAGGKFRDVAVTLKAAP
jgi:hypothetical protein